MNDKYFSYLNRLIGGNWRDKNGKWAKTGLKGLVNRTKQSARYRIANSNLGK